jgi:excinuclease ABC subunit C
MTTSRASCSSGDRALTADLYFGPYLLLSHAERTLRMIPRFFQVANCHLQFDDRPQPCLYCHLDQCLAPCAGKAGPAEYAGRVREARQFLEGRNEAQHERVETRMRKASAQPEFERAARYREMPPSLSVELEAENDLDPTRARRLLGGTSRGETGRD